MSTEFKILLLLIVMIAVYIFDIVLMFHVAFSENGNMDLPFVLLLIAWIIQQRIEILILQENSKKDNAS